MRALFWVLLAAQPLAAQAQPVTITSGEYSVQLSRDNLMGYRGTRQALSLRQMFKLPFEAFAREQDHETLPCSFEHTLQVISLAGPYLSLRDDFYSFCRRAAHPTVEQQVATFDLRKPDRPIAITDLFPEQAVLGALIKDPILAPHLKSRPPSLAALRAALPEDGVQAGSTSCTFLLTDDFTTRFALHHVQGSQVAVRISLEPLAGACRGITADLGLLLPLPDALKSEKFVTPPARTIKPKIAFQAAAKSP